MRVLAIGASGAIGTRLVPLLRQRGHEVIGSCHAAHHAERLRALGAEPIVLDALDAQAVHDAVVGARPDAIAYEATALANLSDFVHFDRSFAQTNRLRTEGTDILLAAARAGGVPRVVAQSYALYRYVHTVESVNTEDDALDPDPPAAMRETVAAMTHLDQAVTAAGGVALRYGNLYGDPNDGLVAAARAEVSAHRQWRRRLVARSPGGCRGGNRPCP